MLHSFRLDMVDKVCRMFKQNPLPFGGLQVVLCGDFFQLPPISRGGEDARFVNRSQVWNDMKLKVCYLSEQHRQEDDILTSLLNDIRKNNTGEHSLTPLRKCYKKDVSKFSAAIKLHTHNFNVDTVNGEIDIPEDGLWQVNVFLGGTQGSTTFDESMILELDINATRKTISVLDIASSSTNQRTFSASITLRLLENDTLSIYCTATAALGTFTVNDAMLQIKKLSD